MGVAKRIQCLGPVGGLLGAVVLALGGCAGDPGPYPELPPLGMQTEFSSRNLCGLGVSPEVRLGGVPAQAAIYRWRMTNVGVLRAPRWQADLPAGGPVIPAGAVPDFPAPCPGELQTFVYRFEIMALAADGRPLAYGWQFVSAISTTRTVEREQLRALGRVPAPDRTTPIGASKPTFFTY
jgi:hypothetical protein